MPDRTLGQAGYGQRRLGEMKEVVGCDIPDGSKDERLDSIEANSIILSVIPVQSYQNRGHMVIVLIHDQGID
jgi:hypothetical protein